MNLKQRLHAHGWYILINAFILIAISCRYFHFLPEFPTDLFGITFIITGTVAQMMLLAGIIGLVTLPVLLLPKILRNFSQALVASFGLALLFIDTIVFAQYRFHINGVVVKLLMSGEIVSFPLVTWLMVIGGILALVVMQFGLIHWLEKNPIICQQRIGRKFVQFTVLCLLAANMIHIWAAANAYQPVTIVKRYLPLFYPATANGFMHRHGWINEEAIQRQKSLKMKTKTDLHYPLTPLTTKAVDKPVNIMFLIIDSWRADSFNADNAPNLWKYAQAGVQYKHHFSTGNATRTGIFGLFYGIPGTYWHGFIANHQSPVFIDRLQALNYQLGIFGSAKLTAPEFDQTVFTNVKNLRIHSQGNRPSERDADLTNDWLKWYAKRDPKRPTFSFLFYDSPHGYDFPDNYKHKYEPYLKEINYLKLTNSTDITPFYNRYKTSVHYTDSLAKKVLDKLKESGELKNTVVVLTGDHAQELNDNKLGYWGHNGNFTNAQIHVPFAMFGPDIDKNTKGWDATTMSSHEDVVPTLMKNYLGVTSPIHDYSVGEDLLGPQVDRQWLLSSSYSGYAIVTDKTILEVRGSGQYQLMNKRNRTLKGQQPNFTNMTQALEQISRFNQ